MSRTQIMKQLAEMPTRNIRLSPKDFTLQSNTADEKSVVAKIEDLDLPHAVRSDERLEVRVVAYESFTTNSTADDTETFSLAHDLIDAETVQDDLVLYNGGTEDQPDAIDYQADTFDYSDSGTDNTLHVYYVVGTQAELEIRKVAPKNVYEDLVTVDPGLANFRDQYKDPIHFEPRHELHGVIPSDWDIEMALDAPYALQWADETDTAAEAYNMALSLPVKVGKYSVEGLSRVVAQAASER